MANPAELGAAVKPVLGGNFEADTTEDSVILHSDREYSFRHNGVTIAGADATQTIYLGLDNHVSADDSAEDHKVPLGDGVALTIGPGVELLYFQTATGAPGSGPTFSAVVGPRLHGKW